MACAVRATFQFAASIAQGQKPRSAAPAASDLPPAQRLACVCRLTTMRSRACCIGQPSEIYQQFKLNPFCLQAVHHSKSSPVFMVTNCPPGTDHVKNQKAHSWEIVIVILCNAENGDHDDNRSEF